MHVLQRKETKKIIILHRACYGKCKYTHERFAITKDSKWCFYAYLLDYVLLAKWRINKMCAVCIFRLIEIWMRPFTGFCSFSLSRLLFLCRFSDIWWPVVTELCWCGTTFVISRNMNSLEMYKIEFFPAFYRDEKVFFCTNIIFLSKMFATWTKLRWIGPKIDHLL